MDKVPEAGALISIGFAKPEGGSGGYARYIAISPPDWKYGVSVEKGPMIPEGIKVINEWVDASGGRSFCLFEANNSNDILAWVYAWSDVMTFEITPVMELEKVMEAI